MREIKFRVWDKELKKMFYSDAEQLDNGLAFLINGHFDDESHIWMQYTGLKDKNGKEIYEGDIVDCIRDGDTLWSEIVVIEDIRNLPRSLFGSSLVSREVIGNIYENPELLEAHNE